MFIQTFLFFMNFITELVCAYGSKKRTNCFLCTINYRLQIMFQLLLKIDKFPINAIEWKTLLLPRMSRFSLNNFLKRSTSLIRIKKKEEKTETQQERSYMYVRVIKQHNQYDIRYRRN